MTTETKFVRTLRAG